MGLRMFPRIEKILYGCLALQLQTAIIILFQPSLGFFVDGYIYLFVVRVLESVMWALYHDTRCWWCNEWRMMTWNDLRIEVLQKVGRRFVTKRFNSKLFNCYSVEHRDFHRYQQRVDRRDVQIVNSILSIIFLKMNGEKGNGMNDFSWTKWFLIKWCSLLNQSEAFLLTHPDDFKWYPILAPVPRYYFSVLSHSNTETPFFLGDQISRRIENKCFDCILIHSKHPLKELFNEKLDFSSLKRKSSIM